MASQRWVEAPEEWAELELLLEWLNVRSLIADLVTEFVFPG